MNGLYAIILKNKYKVALVIVTLLACFSQMVWIHLNAALPREEDDAVYITISLSFYDTLTQFDTRQFITGFTESLNYHPPLVPLLAMPFHLIFGRKISSCLLLYTLFIALSCFYLFGLAKALSNDERIALLAVIITCLFPLVYGLWRQFFLDFGLYTVVIIWLFYLAKSNAFREKAVPLGIFLGLGLLTKEVFPLIVIGPAAFLFLRGLRSVPKEEFGRFIRNIALILTIGGLIASTWYLKNLVPALSFALYAGWGEGSSGQSLGPVLSLNTLGVYWLEHINFGISVYFVGLLMVFTALALVLRRRILTPAAWWFLLTWLLIPMTVASFAKIKEIRYMISVYPVFGIVLSALLINVLPHRKWARIGLLLLLAVFPLYNFLYLSFDSPLTPRREVKFGPVVLFAEDLEERSLRLYPIYTFPAKATAWPVAHILKTFAKLGEGMDECKVAVAYDHSYFMTSLSVASLFESSPPNLDIKNVCGPLDMNAALEADFLAVKTKGIYSNAAYYDEPSGLEQIEKKLREKELPFVEVKRIALPADQTELIIYKKSLDMLKRRPYDFFAEEPANEATFTMGQDTRRVVVQAPGSKLTFDGIFLHGPAKLKFGIGGNEADWKGEGVVFELHVKHGEAEHLLFAKYLNPKRNLEDRKWHDETVDLSAFADKVITISLMTKPVPNSEEADDLVGWSDLKILYKSPDADGDRE